MPWRETCRMDEKLGFVLAWHRGEGPMTALCAAYGISRKTGYKWLGRYREGGMAGLQDRSRAPRRHGRALAPAVADAIVGLRRAHPFWGPRKLRAVLMRAHPGTVWPAASTMGELLRSEGLVPRRRLRRRLPSPARPFRAAAGPNDVWCIDFKGWFRTGDGARCDPLTITDAWSRYLLAVAIVPPRTGPVEAAVEAVFRRYGLPLALRRVRRNGCIKWGGEEVFVSEALAGQTVGVAETENGAWIVRFAGIDLGLFDRQSRKLLRFPAARPGRRETERTANTVTRITGP